MYGVVCVPHPAPRGHNAPSAPCSQPPTTTSQPHMPGCNWLLAQDSPLILGPWGILSGFQEPPAQFLVPHSPNPADPAPAMAPGAPSSSPSSILATLLFSSLGKWNHPSLGSWDSGSLCKLPTAFPVLPTAIKERVRRIRKGIFYSEKKYIVWGEA